MGETEKNLQEHEQLDACSQNGKKGEPELPERWYCDTDCRASNRACRGEGGKDPTARNLCPYFEDMLF